MEAMARDAPRQDVIRRKMEMYLTSVGAVKESHSTRTHRSYGAINSVYLAFVAGWPGFPLTP